MIHKKLVGICFASAIAAAWWQDGLAYEHEDESNLAIPNPLEPPGDGNNSNKNPYPNNRLNNAVKMPNNPSNHKGEDLNLPPEKQEPIDQDGAQGYQQTDEPQKDEREASMMPSRGDTDFNNQGASTPDIPPGEVPPENHDRARDYQQTDGPQKEEREANRPPSRGDTDFNN
ncbi:MAG: hypothetical protein LBD43_01730, partial [Holosporales bacterium]|nr:hypothetical protein [Holosporales bacterium]